jgi:uncharacterized protein YndB with AHSA1/START domain
MIREVITQDDNNDTSGREQRTSLILKAPVELVWEVWTKPEHKDRGKWIFIMHCPDGKDYPNK